LGVENTKGRLYNRFIVSLESALGVLTAMGQDQTELGAFFTVSTVKIPGCRVPVSFDVVFTAVNIDLFDIVVFFSVIFQILLFLLLWCYIARWGSWRGLNDGFDYARAFFASICFRSSRVFHDVRRTFELLVLIGLLGAAGWC